MNSPKYSSMADLINRSSLGAPRARRARARVSLEHARELIAHSDQTQIRSKNVGGKPAQPYYTSGVDAVPPREGGEAQHPTATSPHGRPGGTMRKKYPATKAGLRRLGRDMQSEIEKGLRPVNVPVRYRYEQAPGGVTASPWASGAPAVTNHHYGDVVSIDGDNNKVAIGNSGTVNQDIEQNDNQWRMALLVALGNVESRLADLGLDEDDQDTIQDAATSAAAIAADHGDDDEVDDTALRRRGRRVLQTLEKVGVAASGGILAHELAEPLRQLLS